MSYKYEGTAPHAVALYHQETLNIESGSVDEAWKKRTCIVLDWIAPIYT